MLLPYGWQLAFTNSRSRELRHCVRPQSFLAVSTPLHCACATEGWAIGRYRYGQQGAGPGRDKRQAPGPPGAQAIPQGLVFHPPPRQRKGTAPVRSAVLPEYRSEEHQSELQSLMRISYAVFCLKQKKKSTHINTRHVYEKRY